MKYKAVIIICAVFLFTTPVYADNSNTIVYRTKSGECYHTEKDTNALSESKIPITLKEAVDQGLRPCGNCHPPTLSVWGKNYKAEDDKKIELNKEVNNKKNAATQKALDAMENGTYRSQQTTPTPTPIIEPDLPDNENNPNVMGTVALSAAVGAGVSALIGKLKK